MRNTIRHWRTSTICGGVAAMAAALLLTAGGWRAGVAIGRVHGQVTLNGSPLAKGCSVLFLPKSSGADIGSGAIQDGGTFIATSGEHPGLPIGEYRVLVLPPALDPKEAEVVESRNQAIVVSAMITGDRERLEQLSAPQADIVPKKYWTEGTSGLVFVVKRGDNPANFVLTSRDD